jgi:Flp pilus assembly protein TadG
MHTSRIRNWIKRCINPNLWGRIKNEKGQALVELALSMPLLILLLVGTAEFSRVVNASIEVSDAARAGVSYGARQSIAAGDTTGIQTAASKDAPDITLDPATVSKSCICSDGTASNCAPTSCSGSNIETILTVQTQATFDPGIHLPGFAGSFTLHGQAVQKVLQ